MKKRFLLFLFFVLMCIAIIPQTSSAQEDTSVVVIPRVEFNEMLDNIRTLLESDSLKLETINAQKNELTTLHFIIQNDTIKDHYQVRSLELANEQILLMEDRISKLSKNHWYDSNRFWYVSGILTIYIASEVLENRTFGGG